MKFKDYYKEGLMSAIGDNIMDNSQLVEIGDIAISDKFGPQKIVGLEKVERGEKEGEPVNRLTLEYIQSDRAIISLANNHFLYGYQVTGIKKAKKPRIGTKGGLTEGQDTSKLKNLVAQVAQKEYEKWQPEEEGGEDEWGGRRNLSHNSREYSWSIE